MVLAERRTVNVETAAKILGIGRSACFDAIHRGEIAHIRIGKRIVIPLAALEKMLGEAVPQNGPGEAA